MNLSKSCAPLSTFTIFVCAILCTSFVVAGGQSMNLSNASTQGTASTSMSLTLDSSAQTREDVAPRPQIYRSAVLVRLDT